MLLNKKYENFIIELLDNLFTYESSYLYLNFNRDLIKNLFELLMKNSDILYYNLILKIFYYLIEIIGEKEEHISSLLMSYAFEYKNNYNIHSNACDKLCNLINHIDEKIKINTLKLIIELIKSSENTENFKQKDKFFEEFYKSNIIKILEKNVTCNSKDFQKLIKEFSILSGNIIKGSEYELEITKKKLEDLKKEVEKLEKENESNIIQEQYNDMIIKELIKFRNLSENNKKFFLPNNPKFHHTKENDNLNLLLNNENIDIKKEINNYIVSEKHQLKTNINILREEEKKCNNAQKDLNAIKKSNNILIDEINKLTDKRKTDPEIIEKFKYYENKSYEANLEKQNYEKKIEEIQDTILTIQNYLASDNEKIKNNENIINEEINILNNLKNEEIEIKNEIKEVNEKISFLNKDEEINNLLDIKKKYENKIKELENIEKENIQNYKKINDIFLNEKKELNTKISKLKNQIENIKNNKKTKNKFLNSKIYVVNSFNLFGKFINTKNNYHNINKISLEKKSNGIPLSNVPSNPNIPSISNMPPIPSYSKCSIYS